VALAQAGIAYTMRGGERFFERPEVREAVVRLRGRLAAGESWSDSVTGVPETTEADVTAVPLVDDSGRPSRGPVTSEVVAVLAGMGWEEGGAPTGGAARERWESLSALVALADEVESGGGESLAAVVGELERRAALSHAPTVDGVTVATLHAAKGLEWPVVFIVGCAEGSLPIVHADTQERVEEERRLFFVGVTRARDRLVVSWALTRNGTGRHREPSRFLAEMRRSSSALTDSATSSGLVHQGRSQSPRERRRRPPSRCRVCGAGLLTAPERTLGRCRTCPGSPDEELAERLRAWRLDTARAREVPAFVVFSDLTLTALAERKPRDQAALLDIPGIGPTKIELYGEALLELVSQTGAG
jgi:DNA helicase-2/ATP-dependent DNA helicase PcrA